MKSNEELFQKLWKIFYPEGERGHIHDPRVKCAIDRMYRIVKAPEPDYDRMWQSMYGRLSGKPERKNRTRAVLRYAAVIALPIMLVAGVLFLLRDEQPQTASLLHERPGHVIRLTLNDGMELNLREIQSQLPEDRHVKIVQDSINGLIYEKKASGDTVLRYNTLEIPVAADYRIRLSDGTIVYLNAESKLRYPEVFKGKERKVYLEGEAYFEVSPDARHPFKIEVRGTEVEVLGTRFNVNAYPEKKGVVTTLAEGKVKVSFDRKQVILQPGEQAVCLGQDIRVQEVDVNEYTSWKDGLFIFNRMSLKDIMIQMERWYGLKIHFFNEDCKEYTFTGMINKNLPAEETFKVIEKVVNVHFSIKESNVVVTKI